MYKKGYYKNPHPLVYEMANEPEKVEECLDILLVCVENGIIIPDADIYNIRKYMPYGNDKGLKIIEANEKLKEALEQKKLVEKQAAEAAKRKDDIKKFRNAMCAKREIKPGNDVIAAQKEHRARVAHFNDFIKCFGKSL